MESDAVTAWRWLSRLQSHWPCSGEPLVPGYWCRANSACKTWTSSLHDPALPHHRSERSFPWSRVDARRRSRPSSKYKSTGFFLNWIRWLRSVSIRTVYACPRIHLKCYITISTLTILCGMLDVQVPHDNRGIIRFQQRVHAYRSRRHAYSASRKKQLQPYSADLFTSTNNKNVP